MWSTWPRAGPHDAAAAGAASAAAAAYAVNLLFGEKLSKIDLTNLPEYISSNKERFNEWIED